LLTFFFKKSSKYVGVSKNKRKTKKKWIAKMIIDGKQQYLGALKLKSKQQKL
jgi:hypothetical protein